MNLSIAFSQGKREYQQDRYYQDQGLLLVADGMGGHAAGDLAAEEVVKLVQSRYNTFQGSFQGPDPVERTIARSWFSEANRAIVKHNEGKRYSDQRGTTLTGVFLTHARALVVHVGDSVVLRVSRVNPTTRQEDKVDASQQILDLYVDKLTPTQGFRHTVFEYMGDPNQISHQIFAQTYDIREHDLLIVASDGLYTGKNASTTERETQDLLSNIGTWFQETGYWEHRPQAAADELAEYVQDQGSTDNLTILMAKF